MDRNFLGVGQEIRLSASQRESLDPDHAQLDIQPSLELEWRDHSYGCRASKGLSVNLIRDRIFLRNSRLVPSQLHTAAAATAEATDGVSAVIDTASVTTDAANEAAACPNSEGDHSQPHSLVKASVSFSR